MVISTSRTRASRVTEVSREGQAYKEKKEPIGTTADTLAGTAVDCVKVIGCTKSCVLHDKTCPGWGSSNATDAEHVRLGSDHGRIGPAV